MASGGHTAPEAERQACRLPAFKDADATFTPPALYAAMGADRGALYSSADRIARRMGNLSVAAAAGGNQSAEDLRILSLRQQASRAAC